MKFSNGFWSDRDSYKVSKAVEVTDYEWNGSELKLYVAHKFIEGRSDELNLPVTSVKLYTPSENIIGVSSEHFQGIFEKYALLFFFTPLIAAMAGNVGVQSSAIIVQGLANDDVKGSINSRLIKEMLLAALNGTILAIFLFLFVWATKGHMLTALAISVSLVVVIIVAGLIGTFVPLFLDKRGIDPAIATGPFITTSNDIFGILIYFWIAKLILNI